MVANKATNIITKFHKKNTTSSAVAGQGNYTILSHKKNTTSSAVAGQGNYTILSSQVIAKFFMDHRVCYQK